MSIPNYPNHRPSNIEWLEDIPCHWDIVRLKTVALAFPSNIDKKTVEGEQIVRVCNYTDVYYNEIIDASLPFLTASATEEQIQKFTLQSGDTIITKDSETADDIATAAFVPETLEGVVCGYHLTIVRPLNRVEGRYIKRYFDTHFARAYFGTRANGLTRVGLSQYPLANAPVPLPPPTEQQAIVRFLDRETAKIDGLIVAQEELIRLLKEKRQAVISHTVTKGLDSSAPMKPSGINWLGDIPEHWRRSKIKFCVTNVVDCLHTTPTYEGKLIYPAVRTADISRGRLDLSNVRLVSQEVYDERIVRLKPIENDVLYSREGERFGLAALVPKGVDLCLGQRMMMFRCNSETHSAYLMWALNSDSVFNQVLEKVAGATSPHINISDIRNFDLAVPPLEEQIRIARKIDADVTKLDTLETEAINAIALLKERRAALISAAVTGKIDVRGDVDLPTEEVVLV